MGFRPFGFVIKELAACISKEGSASGLIFPFYANRTGSRNRITWRVAEPGFCLGLGALIPLAGFTFGCFQSLLFCLLPFSPPPAPWLLPFSPSLPPPDGRQEMRAARLMKSQTPSLLLGSPLRLDI